jgi:hypothetical protein
MAIQIPVDFGEADSAGHSSHGGQPTLATVTRGIADDMTEMRTQFAALLAKLDLDAGVTDVDYASTLTPAAQQVTSA